MERFQDKRFRWIFYITWLVLLVLQSHFTELIDDEAYYWFYSRELSWGYFDHPPMIALMIRFGYSLFKNELGVRLLTILMGFISLLIIEKLLVKKDFLLFASLVSSILIMQVGGFLAVPDSPYLFFITLFIYHYKQYLEKPNILNGIILGILAACILYSKYHGSMLMFFMLIGNLAVLKKPSFYMAIFVGVLCYVPHILWLVQNDYPSFYYHFGERNVPSYKFIFTLEYIGGQILIYGPITSFFIFYALIKYKGFDRFEKVLKFTSIAIFSFLFLFCFIGTIEANWTVAILVPLFIITHQYLVINPRIKKIFFYTVPLSVILLVLARIFFIYDLSGGRLKLNVDLHHKKEWAIAIKNKAGDLPVVFVNSYQKASVYVFYSGETAMSYNNIKGRMNQYSISSIENEFQGKKVFVVANWPTHETQSFFVNGKEVLWYVVPSFSSYSKIYFRNDTKTIRVKQGEKISMTVFVAKRFCNEVNFISDPSSSSFITYHYFIKRNIVFDGNTNIEVNSSIMNKELVLSLNVPAEKGTYYLRISVSTGYLPPAFNSKKWEVVVE